MDTRANTRQGTAAPKELSPEALRQLRRRATHALFAISVLFVPVLFDEVFRVGFVPLVWTVAYFVRMTINPSLPYSSFDLMQLAVHVIVDGGILYLLSTLVCYLLFRLCRPRVAVFAVGLLLTALVVSSFFPIYVALGDRGDNEYLTLWGLWQRSRGALYLP